MRLTLFMVFGLVFSLSASVRAQDQVVTLKVEKVPFIKVISELKRQTRLDFFYSFNEVDVNQAISLDVKNVKIEDVLCQILGDKFTWEYIDNVVVIKPNGMTGPEKKSVRVKGFVYDTEKQPLPGVTVKVVGMSVGTATNQKGWFAMDLPLLKGALEFSFVGFKKKQVNFTESSDTLRIVLEEDMAEVGEVIVRAYSTQNKKEVVSSIATITAEEMKELPSASILSMLQGRLPGLQIVNQSGAPGSAADVAIRGYNSLIDYSTDTGNGSSDGQPLYVVDGMPMQSFVSPQTGTNTLADLDPSMIESISILKDASAASIYGSRAANGVILITTKKGKAGTNKFSVNASYTVSKMLEYPEQTGGRMERWIKNEWNRKQVGKYYVGDGYYAYPTSYKDAFGKSSAVYDGYWGNGSRDWAKNHGNPMYQDSLNPFYNNQTNWYKYATRAAYVANINLQASGGGDKFQYMLGAGYYKETGIMLNSSYARANFLTNLSVQPTKELSINGRVYLSYVDRSFNSGSMLNNRYEGVTVDPSQQSTLLTSGGIVEDEWLKVQNGKRERTDDYRLMGSLVLDYQLFKGLSFSASGMVDYSQGNMNEFTPSTLDVERNENITRGGIFRTVSLSTEELLRYKTSIRENHNIELLLGLNVSKEQVFSMKGSGRRGGSDYVSYYPRSIERGIHNYGTEDWANYQALTTYLSDFREKTMVSYFGRIGYNYKRRYLFEFTYRRDGSSTFGENHRWAEFPSYAVGWAFSEEKFVKDRAAHWLNWGKVRASYGTSGQIFSDEYLAHGLIKFDGSFHGVERASNGTSIAPELTWEKTWQYDIGLDLDMFDNRLGFKSDYYYKYTEGLLYFVNLPGVLYGDVSKQHRNAMEVSNEGIEFDVLVDIFRDSGVKWRTRLNLSRNWNRFEKAYNGRDPQNNMIQGKPLHPFKVYDDNGFFQNEDEVPRYYDANGNAIFLSSGFGKINIKNGSSNLVGTPKILDVDGDGQINDDITCGTSLPMAYGGWVNEIRWKNLDLNILFNITLNRKILNLNGNSLNGGVGAPVFVDLRDVSFWEKEGDVADYGRVGTYQGMLRSKIERVHSMSLKQITLGYNLPKQIANKLRFSDVRFFVTGENIFYLSNYSGANPEVVNIYQGLDAGNAYPLPQKWTMGLTLNF